MVKLSAQGYIIIIFLEVPMFITSMLRIFLTRSFKPFVFTGRNENKLKFESLEDMGLYVHIPFCRSVCGFCPYLKEVYDKYKAESYKIALLKEIDIVCRNLKEKKHAASLYFGGGTPALMIDDMREIIDKLKNYFIIEGGIGIELHPEDIKESNLDKLKKLGINMVSIGIQSFDQKCLNNLGRKNDNFEDKLNLVKSYEFEVVDVDLIFAVPGQTDKILFKDIKAAFDNGATQVSTYPFIDFTFADNSCKPMREKTKKRMLKKLTEYCSNINIERTSVWTFAKKGTKQYSSVTRDNFLGFGVSAATLLKDTFKINTFSITDYIKRINNSILPSSLTLYFTKRQRAIYYLFWSAYSLKIDIQKFEKIIGESLDKMFGFELLLAEKLGLLVKNKDCYELTPKSSYLYHTIEQSYTREYIDKMWNVSRKEAFPGKIVLR